MMRNIAIASLLALSVPLAAFAQPAAAQSMLNTRLDVVATGESRRVPDVARINAGVVTQARTATEAISLNAQQMERVIAALRRAGIADRDIQTSSINLNPEYRYAENQPPVLTGYRASNEVNIRFRDIKETGAILDALVAQGANQINGPMLTIDQPEAALDEARQDALRKARARADLYARALGKRVGRIISITEAGAVQPRPEMAANDSMVTASRAQTKIEPGEHMLSMTLSVSFELE